MSQLATTIEGVIALGRLLQGAGAISSTIMALVADLTRDEQRTKAMALVGISIGLSFALAMMLGPLLAAAGGLAAGIQCHRRHGAAGYPGCCWRCRGMRRVATHEEVGTVPALLWRTLVDRNLRCGSIPGFSLHFLLTAAFVGLPAVLEQALGVPREQHWKVYLPVLVASVLGMVPLIVLAERQGRLTGPGIGICPDARRYPALATGGLGLTVFRLGLCASLPRPSTTWKRPYRAWSARRYMPAARARPWAVYAMFQFLGAFVGGVTGGLQSPAVAPTRYWCCARWCWL